MIETIKALIAHRMGFITPDEHMNCSSGN